MRGSNWRDLAGLDFPPIRSSALRLGVERLMVFDDGSDVLRMMLGLLNYGTGKVRDSWGKGGRFGQDVVPYGGVKAARRAGHIQI
jgi:hypothetical protein